MGSDAPVAPGDILLGKYRVERVLGKGGMGIVVAARHLDLDELFAIKLMLPSGLESAEAVERFLREARSAAKLKGEHVAKVQDVGRLPDGTPYMVMEHLAGWDLRRLVRERGPLPVADALTYVVQACETLREAHALGIVHRDVKSANLFLTFRPNGTPCVKVLDFGISKQTAGDAGITSTTLVGGSPLYMSPEQMRSAKHVDHRTDIWAIGVVLHELLAGVTPFHAESITAVAGRVLQDEAEPVSRVRPDVPAWVDAVILRCLAKHPDGRFQSMDELMAALQGRIPAFPPAHAVPAPGAPPSYGTGAYRPAMPSLAALPGSAPFPGPAPGASAGPISSPSPFSSAAPASSPSPFPSVAPPSSSTTAGFSQVASAHPAAGPLAAPARRGGAILIAMLGALAAVVVGTVWFSLSGPEGDAAGSAGPATGGPTALERPASTSAAAAGTAASQGEPAPPATADPGGTAAPSGTPAAAGTEAPASTGDVTGNEPSKNTPSAPTGGTAGTAAAATAGGAGAAAASTSKTGGSSGKTGTTATTTATPTKKPRTLY